MPQRKKGSFRSEALLFNFQVDSAPNSFSSFKSQWFLRAKRSSPSFTEFSPPRVSLPQPCTNFHTHTPLDPHLWALQVEAVRGKARGSFAQHPGSAHQQPLPLPTPREKKLKLRTCRRRIEEETSGQNSMPPIEGDAATLVIGEKGRLDPE